MTENTRFWITTSIAIIALIIASVGGVPQIYSWWQKTEINGKIISNYGGTNRIQDDKKLQNVYVQKIALFSKNKDFFLKDCDVFIKIPSKQVELPCKIWTWRSRGLSIIFNEKGKDIQKTLNINPTDYLIHKVVFPKNETVVGYVSFSVDYQKDEMFEYVRYEFTDYNGEKRKVTFSQNEIQANKLLYDDDIWIKS